MNKSFIPYELEHHHLADMSDDEFPTQLQAWSNGVVQLNDVGTHFGYVYSGNAIINNPVTDYTFTLSAGMYFSLPSSGMMWGDGEGIIITRLGYKGVFSIGGPIESAGRLRYVSGCTDSLLIPPTMKGDPCLNALYFPHDIEQVPHTHPSMRVGMVVSGEGECVTPDGVTTLKPGMVFVIPANKLHSFRTDRESLTVIAFHPDSDYGPTHENHPMINRTMISGISASELVEVLTNA